ncbi:hypothetical protein FEM48_Zijuj02G0192600 [Ziziphus jujuba var. spinosa]|uniref:Uncharacterized protein n=1 Tax=Ziziphus jujuba var. spinosa TaxID=714518 RepID=A0A978VXH4_ZIZJJ|nr:hypothetical protein FEM48_Zijuj02G0192600 [Ziziphus jujuba var. spinosa]
MALCTKASLRVKVLDYYIDICYPEVLIIFTDNFDYQHLWCHFVKGLLVDDDFGLQQIQKVVGLQLFIASLVVLALNSSYSSSQPVPSSLAEIELPYFTTEITSPSSPFSLSLAKHLQSIGAKICLEILSGEQELSDLVQASDFDVK